MRRSGERVTWTAARRFRWLALVALLAALLPLPGPRVALAADASVSTCDEASFNAALSAVQASGGGTLTFNCTGTITFTGQKTITSNVTILGNGGVVFDGDDSTRLFRVNSGASLELVALTLQNGHPGGAIDNRGTLTITASTLSGNQAGLFGGAIFNTGPLTATASTFAANTSEDLGGAIASGLGSTLTILTSTFTGNSGSSGGAITMQDGNHLFSTSTFTDNTAASINGGAILVTAGTTATIIASTLSGNSASIAAGGISNNGSVMISGSIVANNSAPNGPNCSGLAPTSQGSNLSDEDSCGFTASGDIDDGDANLAGLDDNGGPTRTMLPQAGSDAIGTADCTLSSEEDQRGVTRPTTGIDCDKGAVEVAGTVPVQLITAYNSSGTIDEGGSATIQAIAFGPDNTSLSYTFDCDDDGAYETQGTGSTTNGSGACVFVDDGAFTVSVQVCDADDANNCDTDSVNVTVTNVAPSITSVTTNAPVPQGQPVTVTVQATDPGVNDVLSYRFDCDDDGAYEVGPQPGNTAACLLDPGQASATIRVEVSDGDGGVTTGLVVVGQTVTLCLNYATGALSATTAAGGCAAGTRPLVLPGASPLTLCINLYTGAISRAPGGSCPPGQRPHLVPGNGPLAYCQSLWTGKLRVAGPAGQCVAYEVPGVVPG